MFPFSESHCREDLFPLTLTRHTADIRVGILTIREKWAKASERFSTLRKITDIPADLVPGEEFFALVSSKGWEAALATKESYRSIRFPWDIPVHNAWAIINDLRLMFPGGSNGYVPPTVKLTGNAAHLYIEPGAKLGHCYLNTETGPIHISGEAEIMDGVMIRGPVSIGRGAVVKMGATLYGATTIGPGCVIGGEVKNSVFFSNSNKGHHGYIGDSVIGAWCNLGAGSSNSNVRNNASPVKAWNIHRGQFMDAGNKCGLVMGDHSKCSINASFNTGTVVGVAANIFQSGTLLPKYIPGFSWGVGTGIKYELSKAIADINQWMALKGAMLSDQEIETLSNIHSNTEPL